MMKDELRAKILGAKDIKSRLETVPEWGGVEVVIRGLSGEQRSKLIDSVTEVRTDDDSGESTTIINQGRMYTNILIYSLCDPSTHETLFTEADIDGLSQKNASVIERLSSIAMQISGLSRRAEDTRKNSKSDRSDSTTSESPKP